MIKISLINVSKAIKGIIKNDNNFYIEGVSIDSRENLNKKLFIPLIGNKTDGHVYIKNAFDNGAICTLTEKEINTNKPYILVKSTKKALKDLAEYYVSLFNIIKIAITGSSGKTTTKDILASVISQKYKVIKTKGNFNNEIGLPLTVFNLDYTTEVAIFEMGMNNLLEIHNLSKIVKPDICIITNIGISHIGNLGCKENILKAKCEIFDYMKKDGIVILNYDDKMLRSLENKFKNIYFYSLNKNKFCFDNFFYVDNIIYNNVYSTSFYILNKKEKFKCEIPFIGKYMIYNILVAFIASNILNLNEQEIKKGIKNIKLPKDRMEIIKINNFTIINDVYNSNPISVKEAVDILSFYKTRKVCILGDMMELGKYSEQMHFDIGKYVANKKIDLIIYIGDSANNMYKGSLKIIEKNKFKDINIFYYKNKQDFINEKDKLLKKEDTILLKASRGMKFEYIVKNLRMCNNG